jgi:hypothetical protein
VFGLFTGANMGMSAESMLSFTTSMLPQLPGISGEITSEALELSGLPAFRVGYGWELPRSDGSRTPAHVEQYTVLDPSRLWVFSVTDDAPAADAWKPLAESFELLP